MNKKIEVDLGDFTLKTLAQMYIDAVVGVWDGFDMAPLEMAIRKHVCRAYLWRNLRGGKKLWKAYIHQDYPKVWDFWVLVTTIPGGKDG